MLKTFWFSYISCEWQLGSLLNLLWNGGSSAKLSFDQGNHFQHENIFKKVLGWPMRQLR